MGVDDRATDRKPHAHANGLRREKKSVEQAIHGLRSQHRAGILNRDQYCAEPVA